MKKSGKVNVVPESYRPTDGKLKNGEEFVPTMVGAYYASSLEYGLNAVPQYNNAGDLACPMDDEIKKVFKPTRQYGTFGALRCDVDESQYRYQGSRYILELSSVEETVAVADSLDEAVELIGSEMSKLQYTSTDGTKISYTDAVKLQHSYKSHNEEVQRQIDELIKDRGYAPIFVNGRWERKQYPDSLLSDIAKLAATKKSVTGFNIKIQVTGKHTIAKEDNYVKSSISADKLEEMRRALAYKEKDSFSQGSVRLGTLVVPIQHVSQLAAVKKVLENLPQGRLSKWPESVRNSTIRLDRVERTSV